ncbi:hypothetical protein BCR33DRAFT_713099 [Rhizoclosmatium globosum]|uniref:Uncharacterized protein n=1 Tax=Rhizoclosmatium globosum TaxID=329046 RepID=A0A1Y2CTB8_9FUNG|nr:hypothetical protein BCR33DRAFT_713099 [Rhizoclosmatium globosum]|eukprot:ORY50271.1 hypothetical protein BCR33DRAFT_713099 [Rhizoclosmatium globosum]
MTLGIQPAAAKIMTVKRWRNRHVKKRSRETIIPARITNLSNLAQVPSQVESASTSPHLSVVVTPDADVVNEPIITKEQQAWLIKTSNILSCQHDSLLSRSDEDGSNTQSGTEISLLGTINSSETYLETDVRDPDEFDSLERFLLNTSMEITKRARQEWDVSSEATEFPELENEPLSESDGISENEVSELVNEEDEEELCEIGDTSVSYQTRVLYDALKTSQNLPVSNIRDTHLLEFQQYVLSFPV